ELETEVEPADRQRAARPAAGGGAGDRQDVPRPAAGAAAAERGPRPDLAALRMAPDDLEYRPRRGWIGWLVALAAAGALAAWAFLAPAPFLLPRVETTTVQVVTPTEASTVLTATGYTYARERAAVGAKIIGRVVDLRVDEGDQVKQGDVIAVLDSADLRAAIDQNRAALAESRAKLADASRERGRQEKLVTGGASPQATLDAARTQEAVAAAQVGTAAARLRSSEAQLSYAVIRSPLTGVVIQKNVLVGEMVAPGGFTSQQSTGAIVRIADPRSLEIEADINEAYIARLKRGQPAEIKIDAVPDRVYHGKLRQIVPTADRVKAVVQVKVTVDDADRRLVPDMSTTVTFLGAGVDSAALAAKPKLFVPRTAVRKDGGAAFVFKVVDGRLRKTEVALAPEVPARAGSASGTGGAATAGGSPGAAGDRVEVVSGVSGGETIVRTGVEKLKDGQRVRVAESS
ncbi:MAG TPA: efflux RND transporter periplasmic adaptor subunit, partial [Thermoanaerobaculia bacterium]|nr:efflux RND transporter periplasmic adaptor subunit [Thermoanaerobaculia bacterium]